MSKTILSQKHQQEIYSAFSINQEHFSDQLYILAAFGSMSKQDGDVCTANYMELLDRLCTGGESMDQE